MAYFRAENVSISFGGLRALNGVSFEVNKGEIFSIIGPNGAGKTTIFNCINRYYDLDDGAFYLNNRNICKVKSHAIADMGIARLDARPDRGKNRLKRTQGAGAGRCRAGTTVQSRNADRFQSSLIDVSCKGKEEIGVAESGRRRLYPSA